MATDRKRTGQLGEQIAASRLESLGYQLLDRNWRRDGGELDLVMQDQEMVVFVEVKTRHGESHGPAEAGISGRQAAKLMATAEWYLAEHPQFENLLWRIDLVAITLGNGGQIKRYAHLVNAVQSG